MYYAVFTKNEFVADYCDGKEAYKSAKDLGNKYGKNITDCLLQNNRISFCKIYKIMKKGICYDYRTAEN